MKLGTDEKQQTLLAREEVIGRTPRLLKSGKQGPEFYRGLWESILSGRPWQGEFVERLHRVPRAAGAIDGAAPLKRRLIWINRQAGGAASIHS